MTVIDRAYNTLCHNVLDYGYLRPSRVEDTYSLPGLRIQTSLAELEFPILTSRQIFYKGVLGELAAFLQGATMLRDFEHHGCNYWAHNAGQWKKNYGKEKTNWAVGRIYGAQWRNWGCTNLDQLRMLVNGLKTDKYGRRHILTTWNPEELDDMCLPPCHLLTQFYARQENYLDCVVYMRSVDLALGLPSDLVLYGALLLLVAKEVDMVPGRLIMQFGDAHIYVPHIEQLREQINRPVKLHGAVPVLATNASLFNFEANQLTFANYSPQEAIKYELL